LGGRDIKSRRLLSFLERKAMNDAINVDAAQGDAQDDAPLASEDGHQLTPAASSGTQPAAGRNQIGQSSTTVYVSVHGGNNDLLRVIIDRTAPRNKIIRDLALELSKFGVPYRSVDPRIFDAVRLQEQENVSFQEASTRVFGNPDMAERIRYWRNNWSRQ
jgi:hypothetical protein